MMNSSLRWVTFQSDFDFGYLLKLLTFEELPSTYEEFLKHIFVFFPSLCDVHSLATSTHKLSGSFSTILEQLEVLTSSHFSFLDS